MRKFFRCFSLAGLFALGAACENSGGAKFSKAGDAAVEGRRADVEQEIVHLKDHPWAGQYYTGDGLGVNISVSLAPTNGFVFGWHGCLGLYDQNYGSVIETNGLLKLKFSLPNQRKGFQGLAEELVPVRWGARHYLVASDAMADFCNEINSGREPRQDMHGRHLLRDGDEKKDAGGAPEIPAKFRQYLLKEPIVAKIVAIGKVTTRPSIVDFKFKDIEVTLNAGKKNGLLPGMALHAVSDRGFDSVKIKRVDDGQSFGIITQIGEEDPMPTVGQNFSTKW